MERFINNVKKRQALWDTRSPDHYNRVLVRTLWREVEIASNMKPETAAQRFKSLKDTFSREHQKGPEASNWIYYKHLSFLKDIIEKKTLTLQERSYDFADSSSDKRVSYIIERNTSTKQDHNYDLNENSHDPNGNEYVENEESIVEMLPTRNETSTTNHLKSKRKINETLPPACHKRQKLQQQENLKDIPCSNKSKQHIQNRDDDYHFLMSCRKYLKLMPEHKKLFFRIKLQELIIKLSHMNDNEVENEYSLGTVVTKRSRQNTFTDNSQFEEQYVTISSENVYANNITELEDIKPDLYDLEVV